MTMRVCQILLATLALYMPAVADDAASDHEHQPLVVRSRPVIERLPVRVIDPIDVVVNEFGDTLVADAVGKVLFRIDADGDTTILGKQLHGIARVADSRVFGVHVLLAGKDSGRIVRMSEAGFESEFAFQPAGLGADSIGNLWTANAATGDVIKIDFAGKQKVVTRLSESVKDVAADRLGAIVLLKSGKLVSVIDSETTKTIGYVPRSASRLKLRKTGDVIALAEDENGRTMLVRPTAEQQKVNRFAATPQGTSAFAFDNLGNLTLANPDLRAITRVTSHFSVPCPHCGQMVPMEFLPDAPAHEPRTRRSF